MNKQFVLRRTTTNGTTFFRKNTTTTRESAIWTERQSEATLYTAGEAEVWNLCFKGLGHEMVEYSPCADGHDFSEVELDEWSASGVHESQLSVGLTISCRDCGKTACVSTEIDIHPRDWS